MTKQKHMVGFWLFALKNKISIRTEKEKMEIIISVTINIYRKKDLVKFQFDLVKLSFLYI